MFFWTVAPSYQFSDIAARSPNAQYRLDRYKHPVVLWQCPACNHHGVPKMDRDMLIRELGPATNVVWAVRELVGCRHRNKVSNMCRAVPVL